MKIINEVVYKLDCETEAQIKKAERLQQRLYKKYNSVRVYLSGLYQISIIAKDKIT